VSILCVFLEVGQNAGPDKITVSSSCDPAASGALRHTQCNAMPCAIPEPMLKDDPPEIMSHSEVGLQMNQSHLMQFLRAYNRAPSAHK